MTLKTGGTGLNLTSANHVIHFDRWWNPAVENQATDRAYRIGQNKNVLIHKFICLGTVEERIDQFIERKKSLFDHFFKSDKEINFSKLSDQEIINLVTLNINLARLIQDEDKSEEQS